MNTVFRLWPAAIAAILLMQIAVMAALPETWLAGEVIAITALAAVVVTRVLLIMFHVGEHQPANDDRSPSPLMAVAARMAEAGASAVQIAKRCDMPLALAELVVSEAVREAGSPDAYGPGPESSAF